MYVFLEGRQAGAILIRAYRSTVLWQEYKCVISKPDTAAKVEHLTDEQKLNRNCNVSYCMWPKLKESPTVETLIFQII